MVKDCNLMAIEELITAEELAIIEEQDIEGAEEFCGELTNQQSSEGCALSYGHESPQKKGLIIYKQNPVIRGHFLDYKSKNNTLPSEFAFNIFNAIYVTTQQNLFAIHPKEFQNRVNVEIDIRQLEDMLLRKRSDLNDVKSAIEELYQTDIVLKDFKHPLSGVRYREFHSRIIEKYGFHKENPHIIFMQINEIFLVNIMRHPKQGAKTIGGWTPIRMNIAAALKGKYTTRLHEYIESIVDIKSEFSLGMDSLNKLFGTEHQHFSKLKRIIERSEVQLKGLFNFSFMVFNKDKLISFQVTRKTKLEDFQK